MPELPNDYSLSVSSTDDGDTLLRVLTAGENEAASAVLRPNPAGDGQALERLFVEPAHRGHGLSRALIRAAKDRASGSLFIKPRPFGDMPTSIDALKGLYRSEGFVEADDKDNMVYKKQVEKTAKTEGGFYNGEPSSPDTIKKTIDFQGLEIKLDRPKGFIMFGHDAKGKPWRREYKYDYGFIPQTLGGDHDGLDVFIGPNKEAKDSYWVVQTKPDGSFDEYKIFLGFDTEEQARTAYAQHIPRKLLHEVSTMSVEMMKAMLGAENPQESVVKTATWSGFVDELVQIGRYT